MDWTDDKNIKKLKMLARDGYKARQIADEFDCSLDAVYAAIYRMRKWGHVIDLRRRHGQSHHFTRHADDLVEKARSERDSGKLLRVIAAELNLPVTTVQGWCSMRARRTDFLSGAA